MGTNMVPSNGNPVVGTRSGDWIWNGQAWVCDPDCDPCPPQVNPVTPAFFPPPVFSGPTAQPPWYPGANGGVSFGQVGNFPPNPTRGHLFFDGKTMWLFDGAEWVGIGAAGTTGGSGGTTPGTVPPSVTISATAPGNPVPGMQWWDGSTLRMWDGTQWKVIGPGAALGPVPTTTVVFSVVQSGFFTAPTAWDVLTITATPQIDTELGWDPATKKYRPTKAGVYMFQCLAWEGAGGGIALIKNDSGSFTNDQNHPALGIDTSTATGYLQISATAVMNGTTDSVRLFGISTGAQLWGNPSPPLLSATILP